MADFQPFRALRYNPSVAGDPAGLVSPPYDVVSRAQAEELYGRSAYNIARVDNGEQRSADSGNDNRYTRAAREIGEWLEKGVLLKDRAPRFYLYEQEFELGGKRRCRRAIFGRLRL